MDGKLSIFFLGHQLKDYPNLFYRKIGYALLTDPVRFWTPPGRPVRCTEQAEDPQFGDRRRAVTHPGNLLELLDRY